MIHNSIIIFYTKISVIIDLFMIIEIIFFIKKIISNYICRKDKPRNIYWDLTLSSLRKREH